MFKAFIFDLDGVITDTAELHYLAWQQLADEEGLSFNREINERLRGVSRRASLEIILNNQTRAENDLEALMERKNSYYVDRLNSITHRDILPGIEHFLLELRAKRIKISLASASKNALPILHHLGLYPLFDAVADGWSVERSKPAPDVFIYAAGQLGINTRECVVVEDAEAGIIAARQAGMRVIGIGPQERTVLANWRFNDTQSLTLSHLF